MKRTLRFLPALMIAGAAALCLSFDNNGRLFSQNNDQAELYQTTIPSGTWKHVIDVCPAPNQQYNYLECQSGGSMACSPIPCPTTQTSIALD